MPAHNYDKSWLQSGRMKGKKVTDHLGRPISGSKDGWLLYCLGRHHPGVTARALVCVVGLSEFSVFVDVTVLGVHFACLEVFGIPFYNAAENGGRHFWLDIVPGVDHQPDLAGLFLDLRHPRGRYLWLWLLREFVAALLAEPARNRGKTR